jgi:hypothetical protein
MKVKGIFSSKARRAVFERNRDYSAPTDTLLRGHSPIAQPNGSLCCSVCTGFYSPAAFAKHLTGAPMMDSDAGVYIAGLDDPWLQPRAVCPNIEVPNRETREAMIDAYYKDRQRAQPYIADGVHRSMTD